MGELLAAFHVDGRPRTKGSMKVITPRGRKPVMSEDSQYSGPWRRRIKEAIKAQCPEVNSADHIPYKLPVRVVALFLFERTGPSAQFLDWPVLNAGENASGDIDKLTRNLLDALQDSGLIDDDCLVVGLNVAKKWVMIDPERLSSLGTRPGVSVEVWRA